MKIKMGMVYMIIMIKYIAGSPHPDFTYGINSSLTFKDFEFSFFFCMVAKATMFIM